MANKLEKRIITKTTTTTLLLLQQVESQTKYSFMAAHKVAKNFLITVKILQLVDIVAIVEQLGELSQKQIFHIKSIIH